ncbi:tryptophan synthase subunit alpha [Candidatus Desulfovibrio trichonymphae]|uniref:Tryptophan synthase alpha chain n=1 Tax=Candidatus Desulfovibrio trichonymphae TaxID=1725232 RepID=A0A1J1DQD4_9BACT|nr:tryptophan synthase subunit alpha [Candidatus Desulfovibrio trichonymphae]BAV92031.1 tryptophan synthase subunit alpha [Candidatus Desulfovibrio trichonymphae]GHU94453.1 tryptophan synthase alpha chain [Deltaproteobacteria bacterium]
MNTLEEKISSAAAAGRTALIPFLTAGFPDKIRFWPTIMELDDNGADIIEIGVPFSDPVADGPVVAEASQRALSDGVHLREILAEMKERKGLIKAGVVLMGYLNPFLQYGFEKLAVDAAAAGVHGFIIPDMPFEESVSLRAALKNQGIALIALIGPNTGEKRMRLYAGENEGYVYVVSVMGTTGERTALAPQIAFVIRRARSVFSVPLALGFGLGDPSQLTMLPHDAQPDAVVFGSALLTHLDAGKSAAAFLNRWR